MPQCPDPTQALNYGLPAKEQKFIREPLPGRLQNIINQVETVDEVWAELESNHDKYRAEIKYIEEQWYYFFNGRWVYINGKLTFIDGWHYIYLNHWKFAGDISPDYRDRDRKWYHGVRYCYTTTEYPELDEHNRLVWEDKDKRKLKMKVGNRRVCMGYTDPKGRRAGDSNKHLNAQYMETIIAMGKNSGIVSSSGDHAKKKLFDEILVPGWQQMPFFFKPVSSSDENPASSLEFKAKRKRAGSARLQDQLRSKIDYSTTALSTQYDGGKQYWLLCDEGGKCFKKWTPIRMHDGTVKFVQDIKNGEFVMGPDSTPRLVSGVRVGIEEMFDVIPKKGDAWGCNRSHILSLSVSDRFSFKGTKYSIGDIVNITVAEYLSLSRWQKRSLTLYRVGFELPAKSHFIDPYVFGVWLGDGNSREFSITGVDSIVIDYVESFATSIGLFKRIKDDGISYHFTSKIVGENPVNKELRRLCVFRNKHIPSEYLLDSIENRLQLLAGLIDTDGHACNKNGFTKSYEIVQKREQLALDIKELATSIGFYCSIKNKMATMKRADGSIYSCEVYRVYIYGDIDTIPVKVDRKKAVVSRTKNRRNPQKTGFSLESTGLGEYYGFAVDGDHLFLLADGTVVHNTVEADVYERHQQLRECVSQGAGANIIGFIGMPSTVGEMEGKGGAQYQKLCADSKYENRAISGQTKTGLFTLYISCLEGLEGFVGPYGESIIDDPTPQQADFIGKSYGARKHLESKRQQFLDDNDMEGYNEEVRLQPMWYRECFRTADGDIGFNTKIINERLDELAVIGRDLIRTGNFEWSGIPYQSSVVWKDDEKGRWKLSQVLPVGLTNRVTWINLNGVMQMAPRDPKHVTCCDPYKQEKVTGSRMSKGGIATLWDRDYDVDKPDAHPSTWKSFRFVCTYLNRPGKTSDFYDDVLMQCMYFGSWLYPEINIAEIIEYATERRMAGFFLYDFDYKTGRYKNVPGFYSQGEVKQSLFNNTRDYIEVHGQRERHADFLLQCKEIEGMEQMTDYDLFTACAGALRGSKSRMKDIAPPDSTVKKKFGYRKRKYR